MRSNRIQQLVALVVDLVDRLNVVVAEFLAGKHAPSQGCLSMRWASATPATTGIAPSTTRYQRTGTWRTRPASKPCRDAQRLS